MELPKVPKTMDDLPGDLPPGVWYAIFIVAGLLAAALTLWCLTRVASWLCCCCCSNSAAEEDRVAARKKAEYDGWFSFCRKNSRRERQNKLDEISKKHDMYATLRVGRGRSSSFSRV